MDNFAVIGDFIIRVINMLNIGRDNTHVGLLRFSNIANVQFYLDEFSTKEEYYNAIQYMVENNYTRGNTNTTGGFSKETSRCYSQMPK